MWYLKCNIVDLSRILKSHIVEFLCKIIKKVLTQVWNCPLLTPPDDSTKSYLHIIDIFLSFQQCTIRCHISRKQMCGDVKHGRQPIKLTEIWNTGATWAFFRLHVDISSIIRILFGLWTVYLSDKQTWTWDDLWRQWRRQNITGVDEMC